MITPTILNPFSNIEALLIQSVLPYFTNIQTALQTIEANPGNMIVLAQQEAVIVTNANQIMVEAPVLIPSLQSQAISLGAGYGANVLGQIITALNNQITTTTPTKA